MVGLASFLSICYQSYRLIGTSFTETKQQQPQLRPERAPIKLDNSFLPKSPQKTVLTPPPPVRKMPPNKMQHKIMNPQPHHQHNQHQQQQARNSQTPGQHPPNNVDYDKLRAVADLESEIGEVIDGK